MAFLFGAFPLGSPATRRPDVAGVLEMLMDGGVHYRGWREHAGFRAAVSLKTQGVDVEYRLSGHINGRGITNWPCLLLY